MQKKKLRSFFVVLILDERSKNRNNLSSRQKIIQSMPEEPFDKVHHLQDLWWISFHNTILLNMTFLVWISFSEREIPAARSSTDSGNGYVWFGTVSSWRVSLVSPFSVSIILCPFVIACTGGAKFLAWRQISDNYGLTPTFFKRQKKRTLVAAAVKLCQAKTT